MESRPENMKVSAGFDILMGGGSQSFQPPAPNPSNGSKVMNYQEKLIADGTMNDGFDIMGGPKMRPVPST